MHTFWNVSYHHSLPIQWYISSRNVCIFLCVRKSNNSTKDSLICDWYFANSCKSRLFTSAVKKWCKNKNAIRLWNVMHFVRGRARLVRVKYAFYYRQQQPQHPAVGIWGKICIYSWNWSISVLRRYWHSCAQEYRWLLCLRLPASRSTHSRCRNSSFSCLWIREADFSSCYYLFNVQTNNRIRIFAGRHATHSLAFRLHQWQCLRIS